MKSKAPQGQYRSIAVAQLDAPAYRGLGERQRHLFLVARISLGPCAILAVPGFLHQLADRTAMPVDAVREEWIGLETAGLAYYDGVTAWIVDGLAVEPGLSIDDWKHRVFVQRFVTSLPPSALVGVFVARYRAWWDLGEKEGRPVGPATFPAPDDRLQSWMAAHRLGGGSPIEGPSKGLARAIEGDTKALPSTDTETETETETETPTHRARAREESRTWSEHRLREHLPATCHEALRVVLLASGDGAVGAAVSIAAMCGLDPNGLAVGMVTCTPDEMGGVLQRLYASPTRRWHQGFANQCVRSIRAELRGDRRGRPTTTAAPSLGGAGLPEA